MKVTSYQEAKKYLESHIRQDIFTRFDKDKHLTNPLQRMRYLLTLLDNPHQSYPSVQVSGTSGKGSTAYLISHMLSMAGYKTGFTLSPHLHSSHERMQINNKQINDPDFIAILNRIIPAIEKMTSEPIGKPSYFEILLTMALVYFAKERVDIVVAEVGLEGKYDATNVLRPILAVLTNISLDHTRILGDTVDKIAEEAVSLITSPHMKIITGVEQESVKQIIITKAKKMSAEVTWVEASQILENSFSLTGSVFSFKSSRNNFEKLHLSLVGEYQMLNASLAIEAVEQLKDQGFVIPEKIMRQALSTAHFPGRFEIVQHDPQIILDGAHNPAKMEAFIQSLVALFPHKKKVFVIAFKQEKQLDAMVSRIQDVAEAIVATEFTLSTDTNKHASYNAGEIMKRMEGISKREKLTYAIPDPASAMEKALQIAKEVNAVVIVTGSLYLVGQVRGLYKDYL